MAKPILSEEKKPKENLKSSPVKDSKSFYFDDFTKTLFPLRTNRELIDRGEAEILDYISMCLDQNQNNYSFTPQVNVYAAKPRNHLRRTLKLDVVSEYFIYDIVYKNRSLFKKPSSSSRVHYGYRFEGGQPITPTAAYKAFKGALSDHGGRYEKSLSFDVASYFNNMYHHDIVSWFAELGASDSDSAALGLFLRQIKSGRSIDCLPQGLYPTKMIGNDFLRFLDNYHELKADVLLRFMDDFSIFSNDELILEDDFQAMQRLLGGRGLSVNPQKTKKASDAFHTVDGDIDEVKKKLLDRRRFFVTIGYDESGDEIIKEHLIKSPLSSKEIEYITNILDKTEIEEDDAELILTIMRDHASLVEKRLKFIINSYPHLIKNVYNFCSHVDNKQLIADILFDELTNGRRLTEFQLFWFGYILEDHILNTSKAPDLISLIFNHRSSTVITKAKILEIPDARYGLPELRNEYLMNGQSDWLAWASAVGSRHLKAISRNHKLKYFGNGSNMNHLIAKIMMKS